MTEIRNRRWERFAGLLAQAVPQVDAYELAGYRRDAANASTLAKRPEVQARVREIRGALQVRTNEIIAEEAARPSVTLASLIDRTEALERQAAEAKQFGPAVAAVKLRAELSGHYVARKQDITPRRSVAEIEARLRQLVGSFMVLGNSPLPQG